MDEAKAFVFKSSVGGFNRSDVMEYIEKLNREFYEYRKQQEETVRRLEQRIAELEGKAK